MSIWANAVTAALERSGIAASSLRTGTRIALTSVLVLLPFIGKSAMSSEAADDQAWLTDKTHVEELSKEGKCEEYWNVLWPWAKQGNLEARAMLLVLMAPAPDMSPIIPPGSSGDVVSKLRDITIMAVHSGDYRSTWFDEYQSTIRELYRATGFENAAGGREFLTCVTDTPSERCSDIAVQKRLVPSFEDYARQIDTFIVAGLKSTCTSAGHAE